MVRSLWSGVSGMQGHQIALDVESNNIANVNTNGFKYSRADFGTMVYQQAKGATIPYAGYGGQNEYTVGLGTTITSTTKVMTQGSLQTTNRKGDLAIDGSGMFIVSNNGGYSYAYSRDGAFSFDAVGNLVNNSGYIVQGWMRDLSQLNSPTGIINQNIVNNTGPIGGINIPSSLTIPAKKTENIGGAINLTSGTSTKYVAYPSSLDMNGKNNYGYIDSTGVVNDWATVRYDTADRATEMAKDMGVMFNQDGKAMQLQTGQGIWVSYQTAQSGPIAVNSGFIGTSTIELNGKTISWRNPGSQNGAANGNANLQAMIAAINQQKDKTGVTATARDSGTLVLTNTNQLDGGDNTKNITYRVIGETEGQGNHPVNAAGALVQYSDSDGSGTNILKVTTAFKYTYTTNSVNTDSMQGQFHTNEDLRDMMQTHANQIKMYGGDSSIAAQKMYGIAGTVNGFGANGLRGLDGTARVAVVDGNFRDWIIDSTGNYKESSTSVQVTMNNRGEFSINNTADSTSVPAALSQGPNGPNGLNPYPFNNSASISARGAAYDNLNIFVSSYTNTDRGIVSNVLFKNAMRGLNTGTLAEDGSAAVSGGFRLASYDHGVEVIDSLGNKHTMQFQFEKAGDLEWTWRVVVSQPAELVGSVPNRPNVLEGGTITFLQNGGIGGFTPNTIQFRPNNGAEAPQSIDLTLGDPANGTFLNFTSTSRESESQSFIGDGYVAGILKNLQFDNTGTVLGAFDNGETLALAQVALAKFDNYEGLQEGAGNMYVLSPNSGKPKIGAANTGGRGTIQAGNLEMSNADLSRGLTQLIVVQRGFQANSKTVTTTDQILNTLINLKQ